MQNYEELTKQIRSAKTTMDEILEFVETHSCVEDCRKCTKLKAQKSSSFVTGTIVGGLITGFATVVFSFYAYSVILPVGAM